MYQELILLIIVFCTIYYMFIYDPRIEWMGPDGKKHKIYNSDNNEINNKKAEMLMEINKVAHEIVDHMYKNKLPTKKIAYTTKNRFKNTTIVEILESEGAAHTIGKTRMTICLITKGKFNNMNDCIFVILHELAHVMSDSYGHGEEFKQNFNFIIKLAVKLGLWKDAEYEKNNINYCGVKVTTSPCTNGNCTKDMLENFYKESLLDYK